MGFKPWIDEFLHGRQASSYRVFAAGVLGLAVHFLARLLVEAAHQLQQIFAKGANADVDQLAAFAGFVAPGVWVINLILVGFAFRWRSLPLLGLAVLLAAYHALTWPLVGLLLIWPLLAFLGVNAVRSTKVRSTEVRSTKEEARAHSKTLPLALCLATFILTGLVCPVRLQSVAETGHMLALCFYFLLPFLAAYAALSLVLLICRFHLAMGAGTVGLVLYGLTSFVTDQSISGLAGNFPIAALQPELVGLVASILFLLHIDRTYPSDPGRAAGLFSGRWRWFWLMAGAMVLRFGTGALKNLPPGLVADATRDWGYAFLPWLVFLMSVGLAQMILRRRWRGLLIWPLAAALVMSLATESLRTPQGWDARIETHWPFGAYVSRQGYRVMRQLRVPYQRANEDRINWFQQQLALGAEQPSPLAEGRRASISPLASTINIFFFVADAVNRDRLSTYGGERANAPHLDRLAQDGIRFDRFYASASDTFQNINVIFSGQYVGRQFNLASERRTQLCRAFKNRNYRLMMPQIIEGLRLHVGHCAEAVRFSYHGDQDSDRSLLADEAKVPAGPMLVYLHSQGGHTPWGHVSKEQRVYGEGTKAVYDAALLKSDRQLGQWLDFLRQEGLYEQSLIIYTSDHGIGLGDHHDEVSYSNLYQANLAIPLVIKLPGNRFAGTTRDALLSHVDLGPTLAGMIGEGFQGPGDDFRPVIEGTPWEERCQFFSAAYRPAFASICPDGKKVIWNPEVPSLEIYDLVEDPREQQSLLPSLPEETWQDLVQPLVNFVAAGRGSHSAKPNKSLFIEEER